MLVALGAGVAGTWETEFDFANSESLPLSVFAGEQPNEFVCVTSRAESRTRRSPEPAPPGSSRRRWTSDASPGGSSSAPTTPRSFPRSAPASSTARARPRRSSSRSSVARRSWRSTRAFSLSRQPCAPQEPTTNLFVSEIEIANALTVLVEVYSSAGQQLGQRTIALAPGETAFLQDVLATLGVTELSEGQIRVTKSSGTGKMWGLTATVYDDGRVTVATGKLA